MIKTKEDLIEYLNKDMKRYGNTKPTLYLEPHNNQK